MTARYGLVIHQGILPLDAGWDSGGWEGIKQLVLGYSVPRSSAHRPGTRMKAALDDEGLVVRFTVADRYVRSVVTETNGPVCTDSCVELFVMPTAAGYFNLEVNAGGTMHSAYIEDSRPRPDHGFTKSTMVDPHMLEAVPMVTTLPRIVSPEIREPLDWGVSYRVPYALMTAYAGHLPLEPGSVWRANAYKCADDTSHPHWLCWAPIEGESFHVPHYFGEFVLVRA